MLSSRMHVRGVLTPTKQKIIRRDFIESQILHEFREHNIGWVLQHGLNEEGAIEMDSYFDTYEVRHSAMYFLHRLNSVLKAETLKELNFEGKLVITGYKWETNEPVMLQATICNGTVAHQDGNVQWGNEWVIRY